MQRRTKFLLLGALLATGVVVAVWLLVFLFTAPDCQSGIMAVGETMARGHRGHPGFFFPKEPWMTRMPIDRMPIDDPNAHRKRLWQSVSTSRLPS
jgi:hypothetical protein